MQEKYNDSCRYPVDAFIGVKGNRISFTRALNDIHFKCSRRDENILINNRILFVQQQYAGQAAENIMLPFLLIMRMVKTKPFT